MENSGSSVSYCEKMDGVARWFGTSVAAAFFASLDRCSCVNLATNDTDDEDEEEAKDRPLMLATLNPISSTSSSAAISKVNNPPSSVEKVPV